MQVDNRSVMPQKCSDRGSAVSERHRTAPTGGPVRAGVVWWRQEPDDSTTRCKEVGRRRPEA